MSSNAKALIFMAVIVILWAVFSHNTNRQSGEKCDSCSVPIILHPKKHSQQNSQKHSLKTPDKVNVQKL